ncbi:MAG: N-acetylmuramoyl-L-alanine amidase [Chitinispirillaceae bacterium]|jgi:N-acetyl-anhydromuramyl-L-alanine amidase AmpD
MLNIIPCFLDSNNPLIVDGTTLGSLLAAAGKEHLWEPRHGPDDVDVVVIHSVCAEALNPVDRFDSRWILKIFCDYGVSSHYLIERNGTILGLVPEETKAWHAGGSIMPEPDNRRNVNEFSIGIELTASALSGFTELQYRRLALVCADIERRHGRHFTYCGHEQIAGQRAVKLGLRQDSKTDPGPAFEWRVFSNLIDAERESGSFAFRD